MFFVLTLGSCSRDLPSAPNATDANVAVRSQADVFTAAGDIRATVTAFQNALGNLNANTPGSQGGGRREVNWDAVPALNSDNDNFPGDFFNQPAVGRARGVVFSTPGTGFRVSSDNFADEKAEFGTQFKFFSPIRTFASVGSPASTVTFFVPGSQNPALSTGFGVVFSDVDREGSASIRLFDKDGTNLGRYAAPVADGGLSFVGVRFPIALVARVEILSGQAAIGADAIDVSDRDGAPARDLVIMDDFIFGEPVDASSAAVQASAIQ